MPPAEKMPCRIECFDISNIGGKYAVGSMVSFSRGVPEKSRYRRFRIRTKEDADDYGMMREVLERRYSRGKELPDLIIVDGGKGQLGVALSVLGGLGARRSGYHRTREEITHAQARGNIHGLQGPGQGVSAEQEKSPLS